MLPNNTDVMAKLVNIHTQENNRENAILIYEVISKVARLMQ